MYRRLWWWTRGHEAWFMFCIWRRHIDKTLREPSSSNRNDASIAMIRGVVAFTGSAKKHQHQANSRCTKYAPWRNRWQPTFHGNIVGKGQDRTCGWDQPGGHRDGWAKIIRYKMHMRRASKLTIDVRPFRIFWDERTKRRRVSFWSLEAMNVVSETNRSTVGLNWPCRNVCWRCRIYRRWLPIEFPTAKIGNSYTDTQRFPRDHVIELY